MATKLCITSYPGESSQLCVIVMFVFIFLIALFNRPQFSHLSPHREGLEAIGASEDTLKLVVGRYAEQCGP